MRVPGGHDLASRYCITFLRRDHGTVRYLVALALAAELVHHADLARARHRDQVPLLVLYGLDVVKPEHTFVADLDAARSSGSGRRTTDMECAHRELRTRL